VAEDPLIESIIASPAVIPSAPQTKEYFAFSSADWYNRTGCRARVSLPILF
jgi:hypothetical protein